MVVDCCLVLGRSRDIVLQITVGVFAFCSLILSGEVVVVASYGERPVNFDWIGDVLVSEA